MPTERRDQIRREHVAHVCDVLKRYVLNGYDFHMLTEHDEGEGSRIVFNLHAWSAFAEMLEGVDEASRVADY